MTKSYDYDAFGNQKGAADNADANPFRYCGEYHDAETGTVYLRARYYDPVVGRFTQVDPARDGTNWYVYCAGNPITFADATGKYYEVQKGNKYEVVHESPMIVAGAGAIGYIPVVGGTLAGSMTRQFGGNTKLLGGTSVVSPNDSLYAHISQDFASWVFQVPNPLSALVSLVERGTIYDQDKTLFALMEINGLETEFNSIDDLRNQMHTLSSIISKNSNYFGSSEDGYAYSFFMNDLKLYQMTEEQREYQFMRQAGYTMYDTLSVEGKKRIYGSLNYQNIVKGYNDRIEKVRNWYIEEDK